MDSVDDVVVRQFFNGLFVVLPYLKNAGLKAFGFESFDEVAVDRSRKSVGDILLTLVKPFRIVQAFKIVVVVT